MFRLTCSLHVHGNSGASHEKKLVFRSPEGGEKIVVQDSDSVVLRFYGTLYYFCSYSRRVAYHTTIAMSLAWEIF